MNIPWRRRRPELVGRPRRHRVDDAVWTMVLMLVAGTLLTATTALCAFTELEQFGPAVGSIIVFRSTAAMAEWWHVKVAVAGSIDAAWPDGIEGGSCVLSPSVMSSSGGSLLVEARHMTSPPVYRVHWAGRRTSQDVGDCGKSADIVLTRSDLMRLADVAGGFNTNLSMAGP